jgi:hypothetical protein
VFWGDPVDDTGTLAHFVEVAAPDVNTPVKFQPALAVLGCDGDGSIGAHHDYLDTTTITTSDVTDISAGTVDHEPAIAPTPVVSTSPDVTITYGRRTTLSTGMTYGDAWPLVSQPWALETATPGSDEWGVTAMDVTAADGSGRRTVKPTVNTSYRWLHPEDGLGYFLESASARTEVLVRSKVVSKVVDGTVRRGLTVTVKGAVGPIPPKGTSLTLWRWGSRHVRLEQAGVDRRGHFTFSTRAAKVGTLPLRVTIKATPTNAAGRGRVMKVHVTR